MNIGNKIKELRMKREITQEELANALQVSTQAVSKWENGGSPDLGLIPIIANYFKVTTDFLLDVNQSEIINIEEKLWKYLQGFRYEERINVIYELSFNMSIATRGESIEDLKKFRVDINEDDLYSNVVSSDGIIITSLAQNNKIFMCLPRDEKSDYSKILKSKDKQRLFCECLSDEIFYNTLILLYTRNGGNFTENLLVDNLNITDCQAKDILDKMKDFNIITCSDVPIDDTTVKLYAVLPNPQIVGLIAMLDMIVERPCRYYYYFGGPTNYFKK